MASQTFLFGEQSNKLKVVNVASVPQRSLFRYPGGKTWLVPTLREWLASLSYKPKKFVEPFVGGGIISLSVAFEDLADHVVMTELDDEVAAVWQVVLGKNGRWLADRITNFDLTPENAAAVLATQPKAVRERAFQTILKNRIFHGGILAPGSGMFKYGENGKGIRSRWYPGTLAKRILAIETVRDKITFNPGDGLKTLGEFGRSKKSVFFIDPPYTAAGKKAGRRLYKYYDLDHEELFSIASKVKGDFLMTYDDAAGVRELGSKYNFDMHVVAMTNTHHATMTELLIGRDLDWARRAGGV